MIQRLSGRFALIATIVFWTSLATACFFAFDPRPPQLGIDSFGDKFEHMLAFLVLTVLAQVAFHGVPRWRIAERLSFFGAMIELVQSIPLLHRDCDIRDWFADTITIVAVTAVFVWLDRRQPPLSSR